MARQYAAYSMQGGFNYAVRDETSNRLNDC
jgi:hypothetical protein